MKVYYSLLILIFTISFQAQITGNVTDTNNETLAFVNVFVKNTYTGTTTNENGNYLLKINKKGKYTLVFKYLGFKTITKNVIIKSFPFVLNVTLQEDAVSLGAVNINTKDNPAHRVIRKTIANRTKSRKQTSKFQADFYSRGIFRIKEAPEKIIGVEIGDLGGGLDSTRSGVIYLSETISKITKNKKLFKEQVVASKVSGNNNGFSFNKASEVNFNFYKNLVNIEEDIISPIATYAFTYYNYKLENSYYEESHLINKIKVTPKRKTDNAFEGYIYIVEDDWQIYAIDLFVSGVQIQQPSVEKLSIKQQYTYSKKDSLWAVFSQSIDFKYSIFGINMDGRFTAVYNNYIFNPEFSKKTFTREILSFNDKANKKDTLFWNKIRPVPLTIEESNDYKLKDSIKVVRKSKKYLDSIDTKRNKFKLMNVLSGYYHDNSFKHRGYAIGSPLNAMFNTVQGWHPNLELTYYNYNEEKHTNLNIKANFDYGFSDKQLRTNARIWYKFNDITKPYLTLSGGKNLAQFNKASSLPIIINGITTLFFEKNYAKYFDKTFAQISYGQEVINGLRLNGVLAYEKRAPVFNNSTYTARNIEGVNYTSNNPLAPNDFINAGINTHNLIKFKATASIRFAQEYTSLPKEKQISYQNKYPKLNLSYTKGFMGNEKKHNFGLIETRLFQKIPVGNVGQFSYNIKGGKFINSESISFVDYKHFNGNQTHVNLKDDYLNSFAVLPYYQLSTNKDFAEFHATHQFNGYLLRKVPLLNKLQFKLNVGANALLTNNKPYSEFNVGLSNIGFGKYRFLRIDYVRSQFNGKSTGTFLFGLSL